MNVHASTTLCLGGTIPSATAYFSPSRYNLIEWSGDNVTPPKKQLGCKKRQVQENARNQ